MRPAPFRDYKIKNSIYGNVSFCSENKGALTKIGVYRILSSQRYKNFVNVSERFVSLAHTMKHKYIKSTKLVLKI